MNEYFSDPPFPFFLAGHYLQQFSYFDAEFEKDQLSELKRSPKTCDAWCLQTKIVVTCEEEKNEFQQNLA